MKLKKLCASLFLAATTLVTPFSSAFAGSWDYLGSYDFHQNSAGLYVTNIVYSTGGYFKVCAHTNVSKYYTLKEYDPDNADDTVGTVLLSNGDCHTFYVQNFVDGTNNRAELYVETNNYQVMWSSVDLYN